MAISRSSEIGKLVAALAKAQLTFDPILKESENPAFVRKGKASKYADMYSLVNATRKHLNNNGLTIMQFPSITLEGKNLVVETLLAHESGEWISSEILLPAVDERGFTAHSIGKATTYARRYSWGAIIGAVAEDDDDGNDASGQGTHEAAQEVGEAKIKALKEKIAPKPAGYVPSLFYMQLDNGMYEVNGDETLMKLNRDVLRKFWNSTAKAVMLTADQLEDMKFEMEKRKCPFSALPKAQ